MKARIAFGVIAIAAVAYIAVSRRAAVDDRQELEQVPGAAVSREGVSGHTALFQEALTLMGRRNFVGAESVYREVLALEPRSAPAHVGLGTTRFHQSDLAGAHKHYSQALQLDPDSGGAALGLGSVAYAKRQYVLAERYYRRALTAKTSEADAHWGLALTYDAVGRGRKAREHYAAYLRLAPQSGQADLARSRLSVLDATSSGS